MTRFEPAGSTTYHPDVYQVLVGGRGWSHEEWVEWTVSTVVEQVFGRAVTTATPTPTSLAIGL